MKSDKPFFSLDGPLDSMPAEGQMRSANLSSFTSLVQDVGGDARSILERYEIDPWLAKDPDHYIDCKSLVDAFEYCSTSLNDPLFGLRLARFQDPDVFGCVAALCRSAPTVRESIANFIDYIPIIHSPSTDMELVEGDEHAELRWRVLTDLGANNQANYQAVLLDLKFLQQIGGRNFRPSYVKLAVDARNRDIPELEKELGCRFHKTLKENAIAFPVEMLDQPVRSSNRLLYKLLGGYLEQVKAAARKGTAERVEDYVRGAISSRHCSIERCAEKLGMSVRTLQAHLSDSEQKFSDILEKQRMELAKSYLRQAQMPLDDVAANLGYSEQSSFGRAFKRWTGMTPKQYRREEAEG